MKDNIHMLENCRHVCVAEKTTLLVFIHWESMIYTYTMVFQCASFHTNSKLYLTQHSTSRNEIVFGNKDHNTTYRKKTNTSVLLLFFLVLIRIQNISIRLIGTTQSVCIISFGTCVYRNSIIGSYELVSMT